MELPVHPLLSLVESNANELKMLLKNYIDFTVERQFDQLKNSIVDMIATGQIGSQSSDSASEYTSQTTFPTGQSIADPENLPNLHHSNDHLSITHEQNIIHPSADVNALVSFQSPLNTTQVTSSNEQCPLINTSPVIKRECLEDSSITIPINVQCNDAPNDEDKEQSNNADIEVNRAQNGQVPIDEVKEEYDDDEGEYMSYDDECEDCVKGICQLNQSHLVRENDYTNNDAPNVTDNDHLENIGAPSSIHERDLQDEFVEEDVDDDDEDQLLPTSQQNYDHSTAPSIVPSNRYHVNDQLTTDQITLPSTNQLQTSNKQTNSNLTSPSKDEDCLTEIKVVENDDETIEQINQCNKESSQHDEMQRVDTTQSPNGESQVKGQCPIETKQVNSQIECDESAIIQQSIPSTSGLIQLSDRNRILMFGSDVQSSGEIKSDKRKSATQSSKAVKKVKHQKVEEIDLTEDDDDGKDKTKARVVTLGVNCTKIGCSAVLNNVEMWKEHLSSHGQVPYNQLYDNARTNQHGQTEYPCTECDLVYKYKISLIQHWRFYHQTGKFKCSACEFVANRRKEVVKHKKRKCRDRPRSFSFQSILQMNGTKHLGPTAESN